MSSPFAAAIAAAAAGSPMGNGDVPLVQGRLLLIDGDGLCYYCAGNDETSPGEARKRLLEKVAGAQRACGASEVKIVTTARSSHKGHRYAVARAQPYQGKRSSGHRPKNWEVLREYLEAGDVPGASVELTEVAEADDLFSRYAMSHPDCVINTQDKDMRMVPGWHLDWLTNVMFKLGNEFRIEHDGKVWGRSWFWSQVLHGDGVDHIPGLPWYTDGSLVKTGPKKGEVKVIRVGLKAEVIVEQLPKVHSDMGALLLCQGLYRSCYGDRWLVELLEQGILLWMRNDPTSSPLNVVADGNPMAALRTHEFWPAARAEILQRIAEAQVYEEAEQNGSGDGAPGTAGAAGDALCAVPATVQGDGGGAGSLPLDGLRPSSPAPLVQCPAGQGGERSEEVRHPQHVGVPAWLRRVLAKA